jgi:hypothetical protein
MCSPVVHAQSSAKKFGGKFQDYLDINLFIDESKLHFADWRHRAITHSTFFVGVCEKVFGAYITNSDGNIVPVRVICEQHIREDCDGRIPTIKDWLVAISENKQEKWMNGPNCKL